MIFFIKIGHETIESAPVEGKELDLPAPESNPLFDELDLPAPESNPLFDELDRNALCAFKVSG